jgi:hypothetical protein
LGTTGAHCWGSVDAREGVDIPSGQLSHAVLRCPVAYNPSGHCRHWWVPIWAEYVPARQLRQVLLSTAPVTGEYVPAGHRLHSRLLAAPSSLEWVPVGHGVHVALVVAPGDVE